MTKKLFFILGSIVFISFIINLYQGCSNSDLKKIIKENEIAANRKIEEINLNLKNALELSEKRKLKVEKLIGETEVHKKIVDNIKTLSNNEIKELRKKDIDLKLKYDELEKDNMKKNEIIIELKLTISLQNETISILKLTIEDFENASKKIRDNMLELEKDIKEWKRNYELLLKKKTGWLFFGPFAGYGINAQGEKYPTVALGILWKWFKIL